ncbi:hypothetical protein [Cohnella sp.]|uniref:hypothetical protein n=1 Tax=Cohnella sp. TaxID=1883426 RepID=UPI003561E02A
MKVVWSGKLYFQLLRQFTAEGMEEGNSFGAFSIHSKYTLPIQRMAVALYCWFLTKS